MQIHSFPRREKVVHHLFSSLHQTTLSDPLLGFPQLEQLLPWPKKPACPRCPVMALRSAADPSLTVCKPLLFCFIRDYWGELVQVHICKTFFRNLVSVFLVALAVPHCCYGKLHYVHDAFTKKIWFTMTLCEYTCR